MAGESARRSTGRPATTESEGATRRSTGRRATPLLECEHGICAGGHPSEAEAGAAMLSAGGNAVDAAVAAAFVGFVVEQLDCGLGGFARISVFSPHQARSTSFDGYVRAPAAARPDMFEPAVDAAMTYYGHPPTAGDRARHGALAVATPGAVAALCEAHAGFGKLPLAQVIEPAISAADRGAAFSGRDVVAIARHLERIRELPDTAAALLPGGRLPRVPAQDGDADRLDTTALAGTLRAIAAGGAGAFYRGRIGAALADYVAGLGGILNADDLAAVAAPGVREQPRRYRDHQLTTCLDPIGYRALELLEQVPIADHPAESFETRDAFARSLAGAFADTIGLSGTSQMVALDREGFAVSIITAVGWDYGSLVYVPDAGLFLNNGMSYFDPRPGRLHSIAPGKAPVFGAPTLVAWTDGGPRLACAGSGGYRIQTAVLHTTSHVIDRGFDPEQALEHPRVHGQGGPTLVDSRIPEHVVDALRRAGHDVELRTESADTLHFGRACAVERDPRTGALRGSAAPHWLTGVAGV